MKYEGKLYGKIGKKYFDTGHTTEDWDKLSHSPHEPCMVIYKPKEFIRELEQALNKKGDDKWVNKIPVQDVGVLSHVLVQIIHQ